MGIVHFWDGYVKLNNVDLSDHVTNIDLNIDVDELPSHAMGVSWTEALAGLKSWSVDVTYRQDYAAANVDATNWALVGTTSKAIDIRPTSTNVAATNPRYYGNIILTSYSPVSGEVGTIQEPTVTYKGVGTLSRSATST